MFQDMLAQSAALQPASVSVSGMDVAWFEGGQAQEVLQHFFIEPSSGYFETQASNDLWAVSA